MTYQLNEFTLATFDPGGTIGWAWFTLSVQAFTRPENKVLAHVLDWNCGEFNTTEDENLDSAVALMRAPALWEGPYQPHVEFLTEDFDLVQTRGGKTLLSPVRINAVLEWEVRKLGRELQYQNRAMRVGVTTQRLRRFGFNSPMNRGGRWTSSGNGKDAFAAMQHAIVRLRRIKQASLGKPWKLDDGQTTNARWDCACERGKRHDLLHSE